MSEFSTNTNPITPNENNGDGDDERGYLKMPNLMAGFYGLLLQPVSNMMILKQTRPTVNNRHPENFQGSIFS